MPKTDNADPSLEKLRRATDEPKFTMLRTERDDPIAQTPIIERELPSRA